MRFAILSALCALTSTVTALTVPPYTQTSSKCRSKAHGRTRADMSAVKGKDFPTLIDVTTEDLVDGLESGLFTSVDLVKVATVLVTH